MKVSICIPTYQSPVTLERLLESIFAQTYADYEVIVSDDSADDKVKNVVRKFNDERLQYYHNSSPLGTPENWNNAVRHASGDYIKIMHHDDWFINNDALAIMVRWMEQSNADFVFCQSAGERANEPSEDIAMSYMGERLPFLLYRNVIGAPSATMYKRTSGEYDANIKYYVDVDFYIRYLSCHKCKYIPQKLIQIGTTPVRVTDAVVRNRDLIYNEFQYAFLKLWNDDQWSHSTLKEVFHSFIEEHPDFQIYKIKGMTIAQKYIMLQQHVQSKYRNLKRNVKRYIR